MSLTVSHNTFIKLLDKYSCARIPAYPRIFPRNLRQKYRRWGAHSKITINFIFISYLSHLIAYQMVFWENTVLWTLHSDITLYLTFVMLFLLFFYSKSNLLAFKFMKGSYINIFKRSKTFKLHKTKLTIIFLLLVNRDSFMLLLMDVISCKYLLATLVMFQSCY